jgi:predicted nuclease of predicted toxin-antitoxin system
MLWAYAREHRLVVLTKDNDFFERIILSEPPPQIVFITTGNCSNKVLFATLDSVSIIVSARDVLAFLLALETTTIQLLRQLQ